MPKTRLVSARLNSLRTAPITQLLLVAALGFSIGTAGYYKHQSGGGLAASRALTAAVNQAMPQSLQTAGADMAAAIAPTPINTSREAELGDGQSFAEMLMDQGIADDDAKSAMNALGKAFNLRKMQAGQDVTLSFLRTGNQETLTGAVFQPDDTKEVHLSRVQAANGASSYVADVKIIPITRQRLAASGEIRSSLYEAGDRAGVPHAMMAALIHTYAHDVDFQRDVHPGDRFEVLYDQPMTAKGRAVGEGTIVYAALYINGKAKPIYRVTFSDSTVDYFDDAGRSIRRALLRTPVAAAHVTSGFGMRVHPLLGYSKMHKGVDFGAPTGTPIFAAGNGSIDDIGFRNGYGRYIRIRHNGQLSTAYAHMSRFNANLFHGAHVNQGEVIGYVGMSGRATGPHLHFEVLVNNHQVNPLTVNMPTGRQLDGKLLVAFKQGQTRIKEEYRTLLMKGTPQDKQAPASSTNAQPGLVPAAAPQAAYPAKQTTACDNKQGC